MPGEQPPGLITAFRKLPDISALRRCVATSSSAAFAAGSPRAFIECIRDETTSDCVGGCDDYSQWGLTFDDDSGAGPFYVDEAIEPTGCTGGHKVCADSCTYEAAHALQAESPQMMSDYYGEGYYGVYWDELG